MIKKFNEFKLNEEFNSPFVEKNKKKLRLFFKKLKQEIDATKEAKEALMKYSYGVTPTGEELDLIRQQAINILKGFGMGAIFMLPGGMLLLPFLLKMGHKVGIDLIPTSFKDEEVKEGFEIHNDKTDDTIKILELLYGKQDGTGRHALLDEFVGEEGVRSYSRRSVHISNKEGEEQDGDRREDGLVVGSTYYGTDRSFQKFKVIDIAFIVSPNERGDTIYVNASSVVKIENMFPRLDYNPPTDLNMVEELVRDYIVYTYNLKAKKNRFGEEEFFLGYISDAYSSNSRAVFSKNLFPKK